MREITVYRERNGAVEKEVVTDLPSRLETAAPNYHERILKTYHQLECEGKLNGRISPQAKQKIRDVHTYAQNPAYWGERSTLGYTDGLQ